MEIGTLYLIVYDFKKWDRGYIRLWKQRQCNESSFYSLITPKNMKTNIRAQEIDGIILETYKIVVSMFFVLDKDDKKKLL